MGEVLGAISSDKDKGEDISNSNIDEQMIKNSDNISTNNISIEPPGSQTIKSDKFLSPLVKKLIKKYNIEQNIISNITGTGLNNRITKVDILKFVKLRDSKKK